MKASLHTDKLFVAYFPKQKFSLMPFDGRERKVRYVFVGDSGFYLDVIGKVSQAAAQYNGGCGFDCGMLLYVFGCLVDFIVHRSSCILVLIVSLL